MEKHCDEWRNISYKNRKSLIENREEKIIVAGHWQRATVKIKPRKKSGFPLRVNFFYILAKICF